MEISLILSIGFFIILVVSYIRINIMRLRGYSIFTPSILMSWLLSIIISLIGIIRISDMILKGDRNILILIEVVFYWIAAYRLSHDSLNKLEIKVENIYKPQLENLLEDVLSKRKLSLIKEESDDEKTTFSFLDPHIKSKVQIASSLISTKRHILIIEQKNDIPNLEEILEDMDTMISPIDKRTVLIKLLLKVTFFTYIIWKFIGLFN